MTALPPPIRRRLVLHAPGFEALQPAQHRDRFARALDRTARLWSLAAGCGPLRAGERPGAAPGFAAWAEGPDWRCDSEIRLLAWDHLIRAELDRGGAALLARGGAALLDLLASGTLARYARAHWRYALFALYPMALLASAAGAAAGVAAAVGGAGGLIAGAGALAGGLAWARRRAMLDVMLADWRFAWDVARGRHPGFQEAVEGAAREIAAAMAEPGCEEVVLLGQSLGAVLAVQGLAIALRRDPGLLERPGAPRFALIGLGSSLLKIALHPAAAALRRDVAQLAAAPSLVWREHASRRDALSFERAEPVATLGLPGRRARLRGVHPRDMVDTPTWRRICWRPLRIHRQYVMGNGRRYFLDIGMIACGPLPVSSALDPDRALGAEGALGRAPAPAG